MREGNACSGFPPAFFHHGAASVVMAGMGEWGRVGAMAQGERVNPIRNAAVAAVLCGWQ
jgi:hypothetical protein